MTTALDVPSPAFGTDRCYDRCNACHHTHTGRPLRVPVPRCTCSDRFGVERITPQPVDELRR